MKEVSQLLIDAMHAVSKLRDIEQELFAAWGTARKGTTSDNNRHVNEEDVKKAQAAWQEVSSALQRLNYMTR